MRSILALAALTLGGGCGLDFNRQPLRCEPAGVFPNLCSPRGLGECADGFTCDVRGCVPTGVGQPCLITQDCGRSSGLICRFRLCVDPSALEGPEGVCETDRDCKPGLTCDGFRPSRCVPLSMSRGGCSESFDCPSEDWWCCRSEDCGRSGEIRGACFPRGERGAACVLTDACQLGLVCTRDLVCGDPPGDGELCLDRCAQDLSCEPF